MLLFLLLLGTPLILTGAFSWGYWLEVEKSGLEGLLLLAPAAWVVLVVLYGVFTVQERRHELKRRILESNWPFSELDHCRAPAEGATAPPAPR